MTREQATSAGLAGLAVLASLVFFPPAEVSAGQLNYGRTPGQIDPIELLMRRSIQRREAFLLGEQRLREVDRRIVGAPIRQPAVPVLRQNCQTQVFGSKFMKTCR